MKSRESKGIRFSTVSIVLIVGIVLLGFRIWSRRDAIQTPAAKGADVSIVIDNSSSQHVDCGEISELVRTSLGEIRIGKDSRLTLYTLGSEENSYEPVPRVNIPLERGQGGIRKAVRQVERACGSIPTAEGSSIFRAVEVALVQLQNRGAQGSRMWVRTDLDENVDTRLTRKHGKTAILNNEGIATTFCGIAATTESGGPRGAHTDALAKTWRAAFTAPDLVQMQPFCPGAGK